jgi:hypothetical protein
VRLLTQDDLASVSGGYDIVYVAANANDPFAGPSIANLVGQLVNQQMDPNQFLQSVTASGIQLREFLFFSAQNTPPVPPMPPLPCPPNCP